ncbi:MAG TPA: hypothetical protein PLF96_12790 [Thermotogota bacterium]|nr:hypothetical protein [Thermotogota bacterium]
MKKAMMMGATLLVLVGMTFALPLGQNVLTEENAQIVELQLKYRIAELVNVLEMTPEQIEQVHALALATREKLDTIKDSGTESLEDALQQMVQGHMEEAQALHDEAENALENAKTTVEEYVEQMKNLFTAAQVENYQENMIAALKERVAPAMEKVQQFKEENAVLVNRVKERAERVMPNAGKLVERVNERIADNGENNGEGNNEDNEDLPGRVLRNNLGPLQGYNATDTLYMIFLSPNAIEVLEMFLQ